MKTSTRTSPISLEMLLIPMRQKEHDPKDRTQWNPTKSVKVKVKRQQNWKKLPEMSWSGEGTEESFSLGLSRKNETIKQLKIQSIVTSSLPLELLQISEQASLAQEPAYMFGLYPAQKSAMEQVGAEIQPTPLAMSNLLAWGRTSQRNNHLFVITE